MAGRRLSVMLLALGAAAFGQDPGSMLPDPPAVERTAPPVTELPPFLVVPATPPPPRRPCHACPNDYHPSHVYLPDQNPDWGAGSCDGECHPCRLSWMTTDFFIGKTSELGDVDRRWSYGCRVGGGHWFTPDRSLGAEVGLFNLHDTHHVYVGGPTLVNAPIVFTTLDANVRTELLAAERFRLDGLAGYRYARLHEELFIGNAALIHDRDVKNHIHAAQIGAIANYRYGAYFAEVLGKLALGGNDVDRIANGIRSTENMTSALGEFGVRVGYQIGAGCWGTLGYTLLYLDNVDRPDRPATNFHLHGLTIGFEARF